MEELEKSPFCSDCHFVRQNEDPELLPMGYADWLGRDDPTKVPAEERSAQNGQGEFEETKAESF